MIEKYNKLVESIPENSEELWFEYNLEVSKILLENHKLKDKLSLANKMNETNYNKYCEALKEIQELKEQIKNASNNYTKCIQERDNKLNKIREYIKEHSNDGIEYLGAWEVKELLQISEGVKND